MSTDKILENYGKATAEIEKIINLINDSSPLPELKGRMKSDFECNVSEKEYCNIVEKQRNIFVTEIFFRQLFQGNSLVNMTAA